MTPYPLSITCSNETLLENLGPHDVVIRIHAVSLNYRDVAMLREGDYPIPVDAGGICASDAAAEIVASGSEVSKFQIGDRVAPTVDLQALTGEEHDIDAVALGGNGPGVLAEYAVFEEKYLVKLPDHLSWEEVRVPTLEDMTSRLIFVVGFNDHGRGRHCLGGVEPPSKFDQWRYCFITG